MKKDISIKKFIKQFWFLLKPSRKRIIFLIVLIIIVELIDLVGPYLLKIVIDSILDFDNKKIGLLLGLIGAMFLVNQIAGIFDYFASKRILGLIADVEYYLNVGAQGKMVELGLSYHEKENTGNKIVKIQRGIDRINELLRSLFWEVVPTFFQIIFTTIVLFWINPWFGLVILIFVPIFIWVTLSVNKKVHPQRVLIYKKGEEASGIMTQSIVNINTVKSFSQEKREVGGLRRVGQKIKENVVKVYGKMMTYNLIRGAIINLGRTGILFFGVYLIIKGNVTVGSLVFAITISEKALISLFRFSRIYDQVMETSEPVARLYELKKEEADIKNPKNGLKPRDIKGEIEFKNVSFAYSDNRRKALKDVNLKIPSDSMTALVGPSGGGKTTLARMIFRHYDPQTGGVLLDGKNLKDYDLKGFRKFIAIVPQDVEVFSTTVRSNIAYARPRATFEEIRKAAKIANAEEFINNLEKGYDTEVGERGIKLSGGQRQRIGIARAILADPKILIFDEATSNLDSYSEKLIQESMEKIRKNRTMIVIAHRLSTIKKSDQIFVLENGQLVEQGTHKELSQEKCGLYRKLIDLQRLKDVE